MSTQIKVYKESTGIGTVWTASSVEFCLSESGESPQDAVAALKRSFQCVKVLASKGFANTLKRRDAPLEIDQAQVFERSHEDLKEEDQPVVAGERLVGMELIFSQ